VEKLDDWDCWCGGEWRKGVHKLKCIGKGIVCLILAGRVVGIVRLCVYACVSFASVPYECIHCMN